MDWSLPVSQDEAYRRAGGRRRYNTVRQKKQGARQRRVAELLRSYPPSQRGAYAAIARALDVHRSTVTRDIVALGSIAGFLRGNRTARVTWKRGGVVINFALLGGTLS